MRPLRIFLAYFAVKDINGKVRKGIAKCAKVGVLLAAFWMLAAFVRLGCMAENTAPVGKIEDILAALKSDREPGVAVLVLQNGRTVFKRGYGVSDLRSLRKIDARTNFRLASCTKQFTAMAVMLLLHDGKLRYEDGITDIFPDFPEYGKAISIRNLLNHTSGLLDYEDLMAKPAVGTPPEQIPQTGAA